MNQQNRAAVPIPPAHDPSRLLALEIALSRKTSPDGWVEHTLTDLLYEADVIWTYIINGESSDA